MHTESFEHQALLWDALSDGQVRCRLCHHGCVIAPGQRGRCCVRLNQDGRLVTLTYNKVCSAQIDPIEKKPLFHFLPGSTCLSIATEGCNFNVASVRTGRSAKAHYRESPCVVKLTHLSRSFRSLSNRAVRVSPTLTPSRPSIWNCRGLWYLG